jgi:CspA family cold shock protein
MPTGTIARLLIDKGFGFIRDESGIEHFFHRSSVRGAVFELLREGQRVEFTVEESGKGPRAGEVRLIEVTRFESLSGGRGAPRCTFTSFPRSLFSIS